MENGKLPSTENAPAEATESESESEHDEYFSPNFRSSRGTSVSIKSRRIQEKIEKTKSKTLDTRDAETVDSN